MKKYTKLFIMVLGLIFVVTLVLRFLTPNTTPVLESTSPDLRNPIGIYQPIILTFRTTVTDTLLHTCKITSAPTANIQISASQNTLTLAPSTRFLTSTRYSVDLVCQNFSTQILFTTVSNEQMSVEDINKQQTEKDYDFATTTKEIFDAQPWRTKLPLVTDLYTVVFSDVSNAYYATSTIPAKSSLTRTDLEKEIRLKLHDLGAPDLEILWR